MAAGAPPLSRESIEALRSRGLVGDETFGRYDSLYPAAAVEPVPETPTNQASTPPASDSPKHQADPFADVFSEAEAKVAEDRSAAEARASEKQRAEEADELPKLRAKVKAGVADLMKAGFSRGEIELLRMSDLNRLKELEGKAASDGGAFQPAALRTAEVKPEDTAPSGALVSDAAPPQVSQAPRPVDPMAGADSYTRGLDMQAQGIRMAAQTGEAKAKEAAAYQARLAQEDEDRLKKNLANEQERQAKLDEQFKLLDSEATKLGTLKVDPDRFWANKGSSEKVMAGIGLVLGAFGSGGNKGVKVITDAIDRDIDAQKADIQTAKDVYSAKSGLYAKMVDRFKDKRAAEEATRLAYLNNAELKIKEIEARYGGDEVKAKAQVALGEIQVKKDEARQRFAAAIKTSVGPDTAPEAMTPEQRDRFVPGYGLALTKEDAAKFKESVASAGSARRELGRLLEIAGMPGKSLSPELRAEASTRANMLTGLLKDDVVGPGTISDKDRELLREVAADPTKIASLDGATKARLRTAMDVVEKNLGQRAKTIGLTPAASRLDFKPGAMASK